VISAIESAFEQGVEKGSLLIYSLPISAQSVMSPFSFPRVLDSAASTSGLRFTSLTVWPSPRQNRVGTPKKGFRSSMAGPRVPLSTLRLPCYHGRRMTQGWNGSPIPFHAALASATPYRF
jgi:hypothetical protein